MDLMSVAWVVGNALITGGIVRALKGDTFLPYVEARYRPFAAIGLGTLGGTIEGMVMGRPLPEAIALGLVSSTLSIAGHELGIESLNGGKELFAKP